MPYSDNMYLMNDDSDDEDYALSPSDGQFPSSSTNTTPHIPNILIHDPSQETGSEAGAESKSREASQGRHLSSETKPVYRPSESCSPQESSRPAASSYYHHHPITHAQSSAPQGSPGDFSPRAWPAPIYAEAPPAYTPSPMPLVPSVSTPNEQDRPRNYNTFGISRIMGAPREERARLLGFQPESMGPPVDEESNAGRAPVRRVRRQLSRWFSWKYALLVLVVLIALLTTVGKTSKNGHKSQPQESGDQEPIRPFHPSYCDGEKHYWRKEVLPLDFKSSRDLRFQELPRKHHGAMSVDVGGQINIRKLNGSNGNPRMVLEMSANEPGLRVYTSQDADQQLMRVSVPEQYKSTIPGQRPCVEMKGTVWVPEKAELGTLTIGVTNLDILLFEGLSLHVAGSTKIASVTGGIQTGANKPIFYEDRVERPLGKPDFAFVPAKDSWLFSSNLTEVYTTTGNINGNWPLYDSLRLHTTSGDMNVSITPKKQLQGNHKPAILSLSTVSGTISAAEPIHEPSLIPRRDYLVDIKSISGKVQAALAFGADITAHTTSSEMVLDVLPVVNIDKQTPRNPARLETITTSGQTEVQVLEPLFFNDKGVALVMRGRDSRVLDSLEATHKSTSSDIRLRYPQLWEGMLYAETTGGQLNAKGKDLKITKYTGGWPGSKMEARKGDAGAKSTITARTLLGTVDVLVGDEE
ncbi:hypothetical protein F4861DRAFT_207836 [Xylaria intraflava]|nr:hypothetical protein F4861DRAFT_207836 [Xylaria intraflava]